MKIILKRQQGGTVDPNAAPVDETTQGAEPMEQTAPAEQDPMMMLAQGAAQALQNNDCQTALQVCQALLEMMQQAQGGTPEETQGEPVFAKHGAKIVRRIKK